MLRNFTLFSGLIKYKLSLAVTLSSVTGYFIYKNSPDIHFLFLVPGIFLLASGSAVLNQYTERGTDSLMERTRNRPIPSGSISESGALMICLLLMLTGSLFLSLIGLKQLMLGLTDVFLYNFVYTRLKKKTVLSILPGALVGSIPPLIGYTSAGGTLIHPGILAFSIFMFLWQLPHFWLINIKYGSEYKAAGFATISKYLNERQIRYLVFFWVVLSTGFLFIYCRLSYIPNQKLFDLLSILNITFILLFYRMLFIRKDPQEIRGAFILINSFSLIVMFLIIAFSLFNRF